MWRFVVMPSTGTERIGAMQSGYDANGTAVSGVVIEDRTVFEMPEGAVAFASAVRALMKAKHWTLWDLIQATGLRPSRASEIRHPMPLNSERLDPAQYAEFLQWLDAQPAKADA